ncbi:MAG: NUDIX hydrolase [Alphaproteobacteria bacterium]|nr:NUDIX hydrolase [Alphaproteobacteria bacterium]
MTMPERPKPVRPRDAASVVLVRGAGPAAEVLMGRRRRKAAFLPNIYVFPGGRVDPSDIAAGRAMTLPDVVSESLTRRRGSTPPHGLLVAAIRETFEETGLLIAEDDPTWRAPTGHAESPLWHALTQARAAPGMGRLRYVARAITPTMSPRRFNTRFFMADAEHARGNLLPQSELLDLRWVRLTEATRILPIVDVTEFVLRTVAAHLAGEAGQRIPLWHYVGGTAHVIYE